MSAATVASPAPGVRPFLVKRRSAAVAAAAANANAPPADSVFKQVRRDEDSRNVIHFLLEPTQVPYANTLRRLMLSEVESVAFKADIMEDGSTGDVRITKNSTPMSNEMLAHRIGLIPIHVEAPQDWSPATYEFKLNVVNDSSEPRDVVAADIEVYQDRGPEEEPLKVPGAQFFHPDPITGDTSLIAVLKGRVGTQEPEALTFTARASVGTGRQNVRFMPVTSRCAYGYTRDDDPEKEKALFVKWLDNYKKMNYSELEGDEAKLKQMQREFKTMEVQRCFKQDERGEPYSFDWIVESMGVLDPVYIVGRALEVAQAKLIRYASIDAGDLPENLRVVPADARMKGFDFIFQAEDHTLGNLLASWMEEKMMDSGDVTYAGYKVPHPLRDEMVLRVGVADGKDTSARAAVAKACREAAAMFKAWRTSWVAVSSGV